MSNDCGRNDGNTVLLSATDVFLDPSAVPSDLGNTLTLRRALEC